jgi:hypothetical protein
MQSNLGCAGADHGLVEGRDHHPTWHSAAREKESRIKPMHSIAGGLC